MRFLVAAMLFTLTMSTAAAAELDLDKLTKNQEVDGFRVNAIYLNDANKPMGAQFVHRRSGFTLDLLRIESVPQAYTWVNSFPVSPQGEPHTQEHLLLGKGTVGRAYSAALTMSLGEMNAFTQQWRTSYHFGTPAGPDVFFDLYRAQLNALLHPNYSDEEIRREVRNFGVTENPDKTLRLEEKGSVYNEMMSSMPTPFFTLFLRTFQTLYGPAHPLSFELGRRAGGHPDDEAGGHPPLPRRELLPRQHGLDRRVPEQRPDRRGVEADRRDPARGRTASGDAQSEVVRHAAEAAARSRRQDRHRRLPAEKRAAAEPDHVRLAGHARPRAERRPAPAALPRQHRQRLDVQPLQALHRQQDARDGHRRALGLQRLRGAAGTAGGHRLHRRRGAELHAGEARRDPRESDGGDRRHRRVAGRLAGAEAVQRARLESPAGAGARSREVREHAAALRRAQHVLVMDGSPLRARADLRSSASR
jgi:hypothetical protein